MTTITEEKKQQGGPASAPGERTAGDGAPARRRLALSVGAKGLLVFGALIVYACAIALFMFHEKRLLLHDFDRIQQALEAESLLKQGDAAAFHAMVAVFINADAADHAAGMQRIRSHFDSFLARHEELRARIPGLALTLDTANAALERAGREPTRANMDLLVAELMKAKNGITALAEQSQRERERMSAQYRRQSDTLALVAILLVTLGLALLGAIAALFFRQLTTDLRLLQARALDIINGYRGAPLPVRRQDEVGQLMRAVNGMAKALDKREKELLLERQKYFHQEKMAAIGALAAGVAHEIGNPIAAISGIAQEMCERRAHDAVCSSDGSDGLSGDCDRCRPDLILQQTQRLAAITREISEFASPQPDEPQFLDLNAQLRSASSLIRYDRRLRQVALRLDLDPQLPAIHGIADQLAQLIMNLLINAMDALEPVTEPAPAITLATRTEGAQVCLMVEDNGPGMEPEVLERAFDAFFTTKPAGKGTGLGLSLCYAIMQRHEGSIEIDSAPGAGTRVRAFFPIKEII